MSDADGVFVTGGSGFVGRALLERLVAEGRPVAALSRSRDAADTVSAVGARPVPGDVLDHGALVAGMRGCTVVYHVAGVNASCLRDPGVLFRVNVEGSRMVVRAAADAGVRRVVVTSSAATLGERAGTVGYEESPHRGWFLSDYERSKYEAERVVFSTGAQAGVEVVCVNPSSVQGPGRVGGSARLLLDHLNGRLRVAVHTRISLVDVADCVAGHVLAERAGRPGRRYVLSGATLTLERALTLLSRLTGLRDRPTFLPAVVARLVGAGAEAAGRLRGTDPSVCREVIRTLLHGHAYDGSRSQRELGLHYTPVEDTLARAVAWYAAHGHLTRPLPRMPGGADAAPEV
ncbi:MAG TPA: NAD-dependent epimerase/dehydratase family protein [Nitriliruptorales bacterium]|nr:NAD-dependent epimerase/dehydratase family protein [Nitriliruptorales bacterium]